MIGAINDIAAAVTQDNVPSSGTGFADGISEEAPKKLAIRDGSSVTLLDLADIEWIDAAGDYMCVHANGETYILRSTLKDLLGRLDDNLFKRIHRSTIVNITNISEITSRPKGERLIRLASGHILKVSRTYRDAINSLMS